MASEWSPDQYERFKAERDQPFRDLAALIRPVPGPRVLDLGCGTGELTAGLHGELGARETLGIDSSETMLARSASFVTLGLRFEQGDIAAFGDAERWDVIVSNAALQWLPDHESLLPRLAAALAPGGQLAIQVPANQDHPSHTIADALVTEPPYADALTGPVYRADVLRPEAYALLLAHSGFVEQHVRLQVYLHRLPGPEAVVEWVKGTKLTAIEKRIPPELWPRFLDEYRQRLLAALPPDRPHLYPFKRILMWGRLPG